MKTTFFELLKAPTIPAITLIDIGASGGLGSRWDNFKTSGILVEPDPREIENLRQSLPSNYHLITKALSDSNGIKKFYLYRKQACSSFYPPNKIFTEKFPESERLQVESEIEMETDTLDNQLAALKGSVHLDVLKVDVEGHELSILKGSEQTIRDLIAIELEINFAEVRIGAPMFSEVDVFLREKDFSLIDLRKTCWLRKNIGNNYNSRGQVILGDALYFLSPDKVAGRFSNDPEKCFKAFLVYLSYGYTDIALELMELCKLKIWSSASLDDAESLYSAYLKTEYNLPVWLLKKLRSLSDMINAKLGNLHWFSGDPKLGNH